ncbi:MAG: ribonuclease P protein subunit [Nanoarchaeota archaeon]
MDTLLDLIRGELIGLNLRVIGKEIQGRIIDETKNLFIIETSDKKRKKLIKKNNVFEFLVENEIIRVDGKVLAVRPEERIRISQTTKVS